MAEKVCLEVWSVFQPFLGRPRIQREEKNIFQFTKAKTPEFGYIPGSIKRARSIRDVSNGLPKLAPCCGGRGLST